MAKENQTIEGFFCASNGFLAPKLKTKSCKSDRDLISKDINFFDWLAPQYERLQPIFDPLRFQVHSIILDILNAMEPSPKIILDLGCGNGMLAQQILELLPNANLYAIDGSIRMLEAARENLSEFSDRITLAKADFRDPWEEVIREPVDTIVHYSALRHLPHHSLREVFTRLYSVLAHGGWFVYADHFEQSLPEPVARIARNIRVFRTESALSDFSDNIEILDKFEKIRRASEEQGKFADDSASSEHQVAWLIEAGFEFALKVYQDWKISLFLARKS